MVGPNGLKDKEGYYKNETKHGVWTTWNDSTGEAYNELHRETFENGIINGKVTKWYKEGLLDREGVMKGMKKKENGHTGNEMEEDGLNLIMETA